jgi:hypothetical protein
VVDMTLGTGWGSGWGGPSERDWERPLLFARVDRRPYGVNWKSSIAMSTGYGVAVYGVVP